MLDLWKKQFTKDKLCMQHDKPQIFFKSQWQRTDGPTIFYLLYRWLITLYFIGTWLLTVIDPKHLDKTQVFRIKWLIYLTNWGYTICLLQSLVCSVSLTAWFLMKTKDSDTRGTTWLTRTYKLYWICNTIAVDIAFGITVLYWALIYDEKKMDLDAQNIFVHGTNSIGMFIELCVVNHPMFLIHVYWPVLYGAVYIIFSLIYYASGGTSRTEDPYIYKVLDWREPGKTFGICVAVLIFIIALHFFACGVSWLRRYAHGKLTRTEFSKETSKHKNGFDNAAMCDDPV